MLFSGISLSLSLLLSAALIWACRSRATLLQQLRSEKEQLALAHRELATFGQQVEGFKAKYVHDLRSPLQAVMGYADLLLAETAGSLNPKQRKFLDNLRLATTKILDIIDQG